MAISTALARAEVLGNAHYFHGEDSTFDRDTYQSTWTPIDPDEAAELYYGDFDGFPRFDTVIWYLPPSMSGGDYAGSSLEKANYRAFLADFGDRPGIRPVYGGHGTYAVAIRADAIDEEMGEVLDSLSNYPVIDDEALSEVEYEAEQEAIESWALADFTRAYTADDLADAPDPDPAAMRDLFDRAMEEEGGYWIHEMGGSAWIDVDKLASIARTL